jgi:hypothetical protein
MRVPFSMVVFFLLSPSAAPDGLTPLQRARFDSVTSRVFIERCCHSTLSDCARKSDKCPPVRRLIEFAAWRCAEDSLTDRIVDHVEKRYRGFVAESTFTIDTAGAPCLGSPAARVLITAYVSATCNLCKRVVGDLYDSVAFGGLKGKARLLAKPIGDGLGERALAAAQTEGKFWGLLLVLRGIKTRLSEDQIVHLADSIGLPEGRFRNLLKDPGISKHLEANSIEARKNGVSLTPTLFINGKRYASFKDPRWVVDAALYELDPK